MSATSKTEYVGCGIYTMPQVSKIVGVHPNTLRYWLGETKRGAKSIISRQFPNEDFLTFAELMELHFIKMFLNEGVSFQTIRKAAAAAAKKFRAEHPFAVKRFDTDGRTVFATLLNEETNNETIEDLERGQLVFRQIIKPFFKKLDYSASEIEKYWPMSRSGRVVLDPKRRFGQPIDAKTGVATDAIVAAVNAGSGQDVVTVAKWLDIPVEAVKAAISFENSLVA